MAGIYIHIPFCASRCIYCGFYSTTRLDLRQQYVDTLCHEMLLRGEKSGVRNESIETVYLGGGTPSQLTPTQLKQIFDAIYIYNKVKPDAEITIEMNPDDVTTEYAAVLRQVGINRVSMGAQTFDDQRLRFLHRRHTASQVAQAVGILRAAGIRNISIDLMYGFPGETLNDWEEDIDAALALDVEHISAYCLMVEEGTALYEQLKDKSLEFRVDEELERAMYEQLMDKLTAAGYEHYEISNFAKPGHRSRHNSSYWNDVPYTGLGAAAHSYAPPYRLWNVADICQYMEVIERGELPCEKEFLDDDTHYNDRITTALRTCDGLDLTTLNEKHRSYCLKEAKQFIEDGLLRIDHERIIITRKGLFVSDYIMSSLMFVE